MTTWKTLWMALVSCALCACTPAAAPVAPEIDGTPAAAFERALTTEAHHPLTSGAYLDAIDAALAQPQDPFALATVVASLDALVWRDIDGLASGVEHAIAHRSTEALIEVTPRLRRAHRHARSLPAARGMIADALHHLALRVGAERSAAKWRSKAGCVSPVTMYGPIAFPPLTSLDQPSPIGAAAPLPAKLAGIPPFSSEVIPETIYADACAINVSEVSPLRGTRAVVIDVDNPKEQALTIALSSSSAAFVDIGGKRIISRRYDAGGESTLQFARAMVSPGIARIVVVVAYNDDGQRVALQLWDERGDPMRAAAPRRGATASAVVKSAAALPLFAEQAIGPRQLAVAAASLLAIGEARRAAQLLESDKAPKPADASAEIDILRVRALDAARAIPRNQLMLVLESAAARAKERCPDCWEARIASARIAHERKGYGTGIYALLSSLGVGANDASWTTTLGPMDLLSVAYASREAGLADIARAAYDALAVKTPGSLMLADLDWNLHNRLGDDLIAAACLGSTSRANTRCMHAHVARSDLRGALSEIERVRRLRGSPSILRDIEMQQLLVHDRRPQAMQIYRALPPAMRPLALLGVQLGTEDEGSARQQLLEDRMRSSDGPFAFEPLSRLFGVIDDPAKRFDQEGAELVARDRSEQFLPGAGTAVLRRDERYDLQATGLLYWQMYDLRRMSGTEDVDSGAFMGLPTIDGRSTQREIRRRIYKRDGRVLDPDPSADGRQGATELSQLQTGDYVESLLIGWALPEAAGQLVVDTPDVLPERTSVRDGSISFIRPASIPLALWSHPHLGQGATSRADDGRSVTRWALSNQGPRRIEEGVPPLEARVAISFGTDSYARIAAALGERYRALDDEDPYIARWAKEATKGAATATARERIDALVAAVGRAIRPSDMSALGDFVASLGGGSQQETARWILEKGAGSRTWVLHRALPALGFTSAIVVSEARPFSAAPGFPPRTGRFVHPLLRVDGVDGEALWIDADVEGPPLPPGRISPELRGRKALLANGEIITVDVAAADDADAVVIAVAVDGEGNATGTADVELVGRAAQRIAEALETSVGSSREELLRNVVLGWLPWADVKSVRLGSEADAYRIVVHADIAIIGFARPESKSVVTLPGVMAMHSVFPRPRENTLAARYASQADRQTALAIDTPLAYQLTRKITLPARSKVKRTPPSLKVDRPGLSAERRTRIVDDNSSVIEDTFRVNLPVGTVAPDAYDAFAGDLRRIDDAFLHGIQIELAP